LQNACREFWSTQANKGVTPKSGFVTTPDGMKIHYIEAGPAESVRNSPAILFVPGWTMPADIPPFVTL